MTRRQLSPELGASEALRALARIPNVHGEVFAHLADLEVGDLIRVYSGDKEFAYAIALIIVATPVSVDGLENYSVTPRLTPLPLLGWKSIPTLPPPDVTAEAPSVSTDQPLPATETLPEPSATTSP